MGDGRGGTWLYETVCGMVSLCPELDFHFTVQR